MTIYRMSLTLTPTEELNPYFMKYNAPEEGRKKREENKEGVLGQGDEKSDGGMRGWRRWDVLKNGIV